MNYRTVRNRRKIDDLKHRFTLDDMIFAENLGKKVALLHKVIDITVFFGYFRNY